MDVTAGDGGEPRLHHTIRERERETNSGVMVATKSFQIVRQDTVHYVVSIHWDTGTLQLREDR